VNGLSKNDNEHLTVRTNVRTVVVMNDAEFAKLMGTKKINRAAKRRADAAFRANLIKLLGMAAEGKGAAEKYPASTSELVTWAREAGVI
jgi:hypothetical protein